MTAADVDVCLELVLSADLARLTEMKEVEDRLLRAYEIARTGSRCAETAEMRAWYRLEMHRLERELGVNS